MIQIDRRPPVPMPIRTPIAPARWHRMADEAIAASDARSSNGWSHPLRSPRIDPIPVEKAIRRGDVPAGTTYRTTLTLNDLGRVDLTVIHWPCHIAVRLQCDCAASYAWLVSRRARLECRLTSALRHPSKVDVAYAR